MMTPDDRFRLFMAEFRVLCRDHGVVLCVDGYDLLELWDLDPRDPKDLELTLQWVRNRLK